jgi:hypothetical protein
MDPSVLITRVWLQLELGVSYKTGESKKPMMASINPR